MLPLQHLSTIIAFTLTGCLLTETIGMAIPIVSVNRHPVKVKAMIVDKCWRGSMMHYYYEYKYNDISYHGIYSTLANNVYGEIGDTIVIRLNENRPSQSIFNCNDFPNRTLKGKEYIEYLKNQPPCND